MSELLTLRCPLCGGDPLPSEPVFLRTTGEHINYQVIHGLFDYLGDRCEIPQCHPH